MINFGIIGAGWRSEFYLRIAALLPDMFHITGILIRNPIKKTEFLSKYPVKICDNTEKLLSDNPSFIVSCVNKDSMCDMIAKLCSEKIAVLSETPIGTSLKQIEHLKSIIDPGWKVQVAEQFHFQPNNQAIKSIIKSGILGDVHQVQLSCCHEYHATSLIRYFLDIGNELPKVSSVIIPDHINTYNGRNGTFDKVKEVLSKQKISVLTYKNKSAVYDFTAEQYFSDIRKNRIVIRGANGEIADNICTYLDGAIPMSFLIKRNMCGTNENLDGLYLNSIVGNGRVLYNNPFGKARLTDEEIAIATCLIKMKQYVDTGISFYTLQEAIIDVQTALL